MTRAAGYQIQPHFTGKKVLITGASGFLATNLAGRIKDIDCTVIRLTRTPDKLAPIDGRAKFTDVKGDIADKHTWLHTVPECDIIFHLAAQTSVYKAAADPAADIAVNLLPMVHLLEACRLNRTPPIVIFSGTATEVGLTEKVPVSEDFNDQPITVYDVNKLASERYLKLYSFEGKVQGVTLRFSNIYGPGPGSSNSDRSIINRMVRKAISGDPLPLFGKGDCLRDYVYISDAVDALLLSVAHIQNLLHRHFFIGSGEGLTLADAFEMVSQLAVAATGKKVFLSRIEPPADLSPIEFRNFVADCGNFRRISGWIPQISFSEGIQLCIDALNRSAGDER